MAHHDLDDALSSLAFFRKYAVHLDAASFPVLTANRRGKKTTDREILLFGDSHSWGQGSPDYDGESWYSVHQPFPYNKGYFSRLKQYFERKLSLYPLSVIPFLSNEVERKSGLFRQTDFAIASTPAAKGFYAPFAHRDQATAHLGYLAEEQKFGSAMAVITPESGLDGTLSAECSIRMLSAARKIYIALVVGRHGAKLICDLQMPYYYSKPSGYPKVYRISDGRHIELTAPEAEIIDTSAVQIDTYTPTDPQEQVYCIDYGQKQQGTLAIKYAGADERTMLLFIGNELLADKPALLCRGIVFDANSVRNFAMGGHTTGQWLGDGTLSFHGESYPHIDEILSYVPFTPTLAVIQAPIVNEYLQQTPLDKFRLHLEAVVDKLSRHLNTDNVRQTDVLVFTTPGDQTIDFLGAASAEIRYADYYEAAKKFCLDRRYGFINFHQFFTDAVNMGYIDHELLFDDSIHPSPYVNEFIAKGLQNAIDLLW
ncbi:hypothetical protein Back11_19660 [Paenibacillus baekrokdamisoli]|uniref:Uncharacterized protein n=1 Tax=Paenibacillus baekrokdamisoli TaxID=1712516 RepID=A0A3G9J4A2_9BACL|nr:SGNH/GDSL hydrolase family protein [Paenibacillus baekrokdamisoli]MBB3070031.1 hypothetical protein [Paenibacillus baekrokdamisoli]BBH20621.1 hypothetical protein Back11_19660 [Paenibacillus baekrokdamisoli]